MKKLMIAAAIVCAAAFSQAAVIQWNVNNIYDEGGVNKITAAGGYSVYLFTTATYDTTDWANLDSSTFATMIAKGESVTITADGTAKETTGVQHTTLEKLGLVPGNSYSVYAVAVNSAMDKYYVSTASTPTGVSPVEADVSLFGMGSQKSRTLNTETGYIGWQSVPEPTSGLLLLLGVAGLALRRRRA